MAQERRRRDAAPDRRGHARHVDRRRQDAVSRVIKPRRAPSGVRLRDLPDVLQPKHLCLILGVSRGTIYELLRSGRLPAVEVTPHRFAVAKSAFLTWLESGTTAKKGSR